MEKIVVYAGTRNVYSKMIPAAKSLLYNNSDIDQIYFLIEDDNFSEPLPNIIKCINVSNQPYILPTCPNLFGCWGGAMNVLRLALTKIFPDIDIILSLDNDTIVDSDISSLWDIDLTNYYCAGVRDTPKFNEKGLWINGGVVLYNLKKIREDKVDDKMLEKVNTEKMFWPCQGVINTVLKDKIFELSSQYNSCPVFMNYSPINRKILHFAGNKNYMKHFIVKFYAKQAWPDL